VNNARRAALGFALFGVGWILFSDAVVFALLNSDAAIRSAQLWKGFLFVSLSALLIWWMVSRGERREAAQLEAERRLRRRYRSTLDSLEEGVFVIRHRVILDCNEAAARMFGSTCDELVGESTAILHVDFEQFEEFGRVGDSVLQEGRPFECEAEMRRRDGSTFPSEHTVTLIDEASGLEGGAVSVVRDVTQRREAERQRERFYQRLYDVREGERRRIAREIHDELGQALTGLKIDLSLVRSRTSDDAIRADLSEMDAVLDGAVRSVREIASDLHPGVLDELGLVPALEWLARQHESRLPNGCRFESDTEDLDLPESTASHVFRIAQEALTNTLKHAGATGAEIRVRSEERPEACLIEVADDGRWSDPADATPGIGLIGMRERARAIGGRLRVSRGKGGTRVVLEIPHAPDTESGR
jgi:two-component system sensor histidine kinase UhpB